MTRDKYPYNFTEDSDELTSAELAFTRELVKGYPELTADEICSILDSCGLEEQVYELADISELTPSSRHLRAIRIGRGFGEIYHPFPPASE